MINSKWPVATPPTGTAGALVTLLLATLMVSLALSSVNILLPQLVISLHSSFIAVQWLSITYIMLLAATLVAGGSLSDIYGRRRLFMLGIGIFSLSAAAAACCTTLWPLAAWRALQGTGAALLISVNLALVRDIVPADKTGLAIGLLGSVSAAGTAAGPVLGAVLADSLNWQAMFLLNLPLGLIIFLLALRYLPAPAAGSNTPVQRFNWPGSLLLSSGIIGYALSLQLFSITMLSSVKLLIAVGTLLGFCWFIHREKQAQQPLLHWPLLRQARFSLSLLVNFIVSLMVMTALVLSPFYLSIALQLSLTETGKVMAVSPLLVSLVSTLSGRWLTPGQLDRATTSAILLLVLGSVSFNQLQMNAGISGYLLCIAFTACGYGIFTAANNHQIMRLAPKTLQGQISGLLNLSRNLGLLTGATLMSQLYAYHTATAAASLSAAAGAAWALNQVYLYATALLGLALLLRGYQHYLNKQKTTIDLKST